MIYLNNAATSYPKPPCVVDAVQACLVGTPVSQYRGGTDLRKDDSTVLCKKKLGELLGIKNWKRIIFTSGATESANRLICGLDYENGSILASQTEHNSILRPLFNHTCTKDLDIRIVPCRANGTVYTDVLEETILNAVGNKTGEKTEWISKSVFH